MKNSEEMIEDAHKLYPGVPWIERLDDFRTAFSADKILSESPEKTEQRVISHLKRYVTSRSTTSIKPKEEHNGGALTYFVGYGYVLRGAEQKAYFTTVNTDSQWTARAYTLTSLGQEVVAREKLHSIERMLINITNRQLVEAISEKTRDLEITQEIPDIPLIDKRKISRVSPANGKDD